jgi:hypothetical protein
MSGSTTKVINNVATFNLTGADSKVTMTGPDRSYTIDLGPLVPN